jgi:hypothetical protein
VYDYERLQIDTQRARMGDPHGRQSGNDLERAAKLAQLEELCDRVEDPAAAFILAELVRLA